MVAALTGLADAFELHALTTPKPSDDGIERLKASLVEWRAIIDDPELDEKLANELRAHVNRIEFLLDNTLTFGTEPVVEASKSLVGAGIKAMARLGNTKKRLAGLIGAALGGVVIFLGSAHTAIDDANGIVEGMIEMRTHVSELLNPVKQIEGDKTPKPRSTDGL
jgi:hypothetical protein